MLVAALVLAGSAGCGIAFGGENVDRTIEDPRITESSGLVESAVHEGVLYTHNDSDDGPRVYAVASDGTTAATLTLQGAPARDWEAISPGRRGSNTIWVGDIGDNMRAWPNVRVYRFTEPSALTDRSVPWKQFDLTYEDGPHNAESMMVHPTTGRIYVVTKEVMGAGVFVAPKKLSATGPNVMRRVAKAMSYATDAAFAPDGRHFVVRGYVGATIYATDQPGTRVARLALPAQRQGESIAWTRDGRSVLVGSEGERSKVHRVEVPAKVRPASVAPTSSAAADEASGAAVASDGDGGGLARAQLLWLVAGACVLIALGFSLRAWAKHQADAKSAI